jgi:natural product precursor
MKKVKLNGRLSLNKETVSRLNDNQMESIKGGGFLSIGFLSCSPKCRAKKWDKDHRQNGSL